MQPSLAALDILEDLFSEYSETEDEEEEFDPEVEKEFLQIQYINWMGDFAWPRTWVKLTGTTMRFEFKAVDGEDKIWNIPVVAVKEILIAYQDWNIFLVAFHLSGGIRYPDNKYQILVSSNGPRPEWRRFVFSYFVRIAGLAGKVKRVCAFKMMELVGEDRVLPMLCKAALRKEQDEKMLQRRRPRTAAVGEMAPELQTTIKIALPGGKTWTIGIPVLLKSLRPNGWLSTDLVDMVLEQVIKEKIAHIPFWSDGGAKVQVYDTVFYQRLMKYEMKLTADFSSENFEALLDEIYPKRGKQRTLPDIDKDVLVVPVIYQKHWYLVLIQNPLGAIFDVDRVADYIAGFSSPCHSCRMLIFDSLLGNMDAQDALMSYHESTFNLLKGWLKLLIMARDEIVDDVMGFSLHDVTKIPTQPNLSDCGVYMLLFIEKLILENWSWMDIPSYDLKEKLDLTSDTFLDEAKAYRPKLYAMMRRLAIDWPMFLSDSMEEEMEKRTRKREEQKTQTKEMIDVEETRWMLKEMVDMVVE